MAFVVAMALVLVEIVFVEVGMALVEAEMALEIGENNHVIVLSLLLAHHQSPAPESCIS
jgi:hypothetical protein